MRIALIRLSALGDILRVLPAWANLREAFPDATFQAVVESRHAFLLDPLPWLERVEVDRRKLAKPWTAMAEWRRAAARIAGADVSLDFHGILKSAMIPKLAGIGERWGDGITKEGAGWMQTHPLPFRHQTRYDQALGLAEAFGRSRGIEGLGRFHPVLRDVPLPAVESPWEADDRPRVVLVPGASRRGALKRWPLVHWMDLAKRLKGRCQLRWSLGPEEEDLKAWLPQDTGVAALPAGRFWELAARLREADTVVAGDTGLLHLAVVLGVPVVGVYGASDPVIAGLPNGSGRILRTGIACSPCRERACRRLQCMTELEPSLVAEAVMGSWHPTR